MSDWRGEAAPECVQLAGQVRRCPLPVLALCHAPPRTSLDHEALDVAVEVHIFVVVAGAQG